MADIFISYAAEDWDRIEPLAKALEFHGFSVWWDADLRAGDTYDEVIEEEIDKAKCVIVAWSKNSLGSRWVRTEANEALERDILVPILLDPVRPPLAFRLVQAEKFVGWAGSQSDECWRRLIIQIDALIAEARGISPDPAPDVEDIPDSMMTDVTFSVQSRPRKRVSLGATVGFALSGFIAILVAVVVSIGLEKLGANEIVMIFAGGSIVTAVLFYHLFSIAEEEVNPQSKALAARWLMPVEGGLRVSSGEAFNSLFEATFGHRHFSLKCVWRSSIASLFFLIVIALCAFSILRFFDSENYVVAFITVVLIIGVGLNIIADYVSLFQTRLFLRAIKKYRYLSIPLVIVDFFLTGIIYVAVFAAMSFPLSVLFDAAIDILPTINDAIDDPRTGISAFFSFVMTTYITSVWLWLVLFLGPIAKFFLWSRKSGPKFLGKVFAVQLEPFKALGAMISIMVITLGVGVSIFFW